MPRGTVNALAVGISDRRSPIRGGGLRRHPPVGRAAPGNQGRPPSMPPKLPTCAGGDSGGQNPIGGPAGRGSGALGDVSATAEPGRAPPSPAVQPDPRPDPRAAARPSGRSGTARLPAGEREQTARPWDAERRRLA